MTLINFILLFVSSFNLVLAFFVYRKDRENLVNQTFCIFLIFLGLWIGSIIPLYVFKTILIGHITVGLGLAMGAILPLFSKVYPSTNKRSSFAFYLPAVLPIIIYLIIAPLGLVLKEVRIHDGVLEPIFGPFYPILMIYAVIITIYGFILPIQRYLKSKDIERLQMKYLFIGLFLFITTIILFNVILPAFKIYQLIYFGPLTSLFFVGFTALAIFRYHLFEIKVILTEALVVLIGLVLAVEIFLFKTLQTKLLGLSVFLLFCVFGYLLVRATHQEIKRREEIEEMSFKLQKAYQELKKLDEAKSEFIAMASHQLRTPLTMIKGLVSMMKEGTYGRPPEKFKRPLKNVFNSNERLIKIVNDLLDISKIELGKIELSRQEVQIEDLIGNVLREFRTEAKKKNLYLKWEKPKTALPKIKVDPLKIRQVIACVVDNAIKYTQKGGATIMVQGSRSKVRIAVADTGEGMTKEETQRAFTSFVRGTAGIKLWAQGAGLGLYLAQRYVELHRGKIYAKSPGKGKGSTFYIELPFNH